MPESPAAVTVGTMTSNPTRLASRPLRRTRRTLLGAALCGIAALGLSACGSEDEPSGPSRLSRPELIEQGDELCAGTEEKLAPVFGELFPTGSETPPAAQAAGPMRTAATALREEYDDFSALTPPAGDQEEFDAILAKFDAAVGEVEKSAQLAEAGDTDGYLKALETANGADGESRDLMRVYGFKSCAGEE